MKCRALELREETVDALIPALSSCVADITQGKSSLAECLGHKPGATTFSGATFRSVPNSPIPTSSCCAAAAELDLLESKDWHLAAIKRGTHRYREFALTDISRLSNPPPKHAVLPSRSSPSWSELLSPFDLLALTLASGPFPQDMACWSPASPADCSSQQASTGTTFQVVQS